MLQVLNCLVISDSMLAQQALERIMGDDLKGYALGFTTYPLDAISAVDREPDIVFIESPAGLEPAGVLMVTARFPRRTYVALTAATEDRRQAFLAQGVDEVISLADLESNVGRHLFEKLLAYKELAAAEMRVEQSEERFRGIIEYSHDVIMLLDEEATVIYTSPAFGRQLGYEPWEVLGQDFYGLVHPEDRDRVKKEFSRLIVAWSDDGLRVEYRFRCKDGAWREFETVATNLLRRDTVRAVVLNSRDVTEQRRTESMLEKERALAEQQRTFISMVSHEFRTPLTIIDGNAQIVEKRADRLDPRALKKRAATIRAAVDRLVHLIETILAAHVVETGRLAANPHPCDLKRLIKEVCTEQRGISPRHRIAVNVSGLPDRMMLDEKLMRQIITNLLSNAVKYSPDNPVVEVSADVEGAQAVIAVRDHGVGIPENEQPRLFQKYFRATTAGGIPGSGLGLNLVRQFVELHNGTVQLRSKVGEGTTVIVRLPVV